jgi:CRP-like cAMP-binding protein
MKAETLDPSNLLTILEEIHSLPEREKSHFLSLLREMRLKKGEFFIKAGEEARLLGFLISGLIRYYYINETGKEFIKHFCFDGHFVTSYTALQTGQPSHYSIEAMEDSRLIVFSFAHWTALLTRHPVWGIINARVQADALITAEERERSLILDDALTRYESLLKEIPGIENRVPQYDIANYLGITPVALSRIRGKIKKYN